MNEIVGSPYLTQVSVEDEQSRIFARRILLANQAEEILWRNASEAEKQEHEAKTRVEMENI